MPYPPPPGPPATSDFQAIGLLPSPAIPDVTGEAGNFLETDGVIVQWEPVGGSALPDQAGHAGEFLTTDGAVPSWAAVTGPGTGLYSNVFDIRDYGAVSFLNPNVKAQMVVDCSDAIEAAIAAWTQKNTGMAFGTEGASVGGVYIPAGNWAISRPILPPPGCLLFGDGPQLSVLCAGAGIPGDSIVQGFGGPMVYNIGRSANPLMFPTYTSPPSGFAGQAMELKIVDARNHYFPPTLVLEDCYPWSTFLAFFAAQASLRCWFKNNSAWSDGTERWVVGTRSCVDPLDRRAIALSCRSNGTTVTFTATLTTGLSGTQVITSSAVAVGSTWHNLEIDYDGAHFDFFLDGVSQGHVAMTGRVYKLPWEQAAIGMSDFVDQGNPLQQPPDAAIASIELSDVARHTGTGSFTPPTSAYSADTHTLWLCNFDQADAPTGWPAVVAQTAILTVNSLSETYGVPTFGEAFPQPSHGGLLPHYMRIDGWAKGYIPNNSGVTVQDLQLYSRYSNSGIVCIGASRTRLSRLILFGHSTAGVYLTDGTSFYSEAEYIWSASSGISLLWAGNIRNSQTHNSQTGLWLLYGSAYNVQDQPEWSSFIPYIFGPLPDTFSPLDVELCGNDEEGLFAYQYCAAFLISASRATFRNNQWDATASATGGPAFVYRKHNAIAPTHIGDGFWAVPGTPGISSYNQGSGAGPIDCFNCAINYTDIICDIPGMVVWRTAQNISNQNGLSTTDVSANNLGGTFTAMFGYTDVFVQLLNDEVDGNYLVQCQFRSYVGSAPAVGSTTVVSYTTATNGFTVTLGADPGGTSILTFGYTILRIDGPPLLHSYLPAIPSTVTNPLVAASPSGDWAVGVTVVPTGGAKSLRYNATLSEYLTQAGTNPNQWEARLLAGNQLFFGLNGSDALVPAVIAGPFLSTDAVVANGQLYSMASPGSHNIVFGSAKNIPGLTGLYAFQVYIDGGLMTDFVPGQPQPPWGVQQTPIHIGEDVGGTGTLASCDVRWFDVDTRFSRIARREQDCGPQAGQAIGVFLGDGFTLGLSAGVAGLGGYATQIAEFKYATHYYWLAAVNRMLAADALNTYWKLWGVNQDFAAAVVLLGYWDLLGGTSATDTWTQLNGLLTGVTATVTFTPPTYNIRAWAAYVPPFRNQPGPHTGSATCVINGVSFTCTFNTDDVTTINDLVALVNASAPTTALVTPSLNTDDPPNPYMRIDAVVDGPDGNGITTTTDGAHGAFWYPGPATFAGRACDITIGGVTFNATFNTDANTSVNDLITRINASAPTLALVTPTNTGSGTLLLTAVAGGTAGNSVSVASSTIFEGHLTPVNATSLQGGADGLIDTCPLTVLCTVPPFGDAPGYSAGKNTERVTLNTTITNFVAANPGTTALADVDATVWKTTDHTKIDPTMLAADNTYLNDVGHAAVYAVVQPLLP